MNEKTIEERAEDLYTTNRFTNDMATEVDEIQQALAEAEKVGAARVVKKLQSHTKYDCFHDVDNVIEEEICRIQNIGFEEAHRTRSCGHSVGDYRDSNYGTDSYDGDEKCVGCELQQVAIKKEKDKIIKVITDMSLIDCGGDGIQSVKLGVSEIIQALQDPKDTTTHQIIRGEKGNEWVEYKNGKEVSREPYTHQDDRFSQMCSGKFSNYCRCSQ